MMWNFHLQSFPILGFDDLFPCGWDPSTLDHFPTSLSVRFALSLTCFSEDKKEQKKIGKKKSQKREFVKLKMKFEITLAIVLFGFFSIRYEKQAFLSTKNRILY